MSARTAERGLFDFLFLAEGLRLREHRGQIYDLDVVGRPDTFTVLAALAAVTDRLGLTGTINTTFNEPFEVARQFATLDHLSDGRAGWNIVTSSDAFTGENFRRGGFLDHADRYQRAEEFLLVAREFWRSWAADAVLADIEAGTYVDPSRVGTVDHHGAHFDVRGVATLPAGPQGDPILLQAGDSDDGRNFGAHYADALFTLHGSLEDGQRYYADVKGRAASFGRNPDDLKVFPAATFVLACAKMAWYLSIWVFRISIRDRCRCAPRRSRSPTHSRSTAPCMRSAPCRWAIRTRCCASPTRAQRRWRVSAPAWRHTRISRSA